MKTSILLAGASIAALALGAQSAHAAAAPTPVYGGGSTLAAKVYRDLFNCFSVAADGIFVSSNTTSYPSGASIQYPTAETSFCSPQGTAKDIIYYEPVGSGDGLAAWDSANPAGFSTPTASTNTIAYLTHTITTTPYPEVQFAGSDAYLTGQDTSASAAVGGEAVFQLPTFVTPIVLAFGGTQNVKLTDTDVCNIFSGSANKTKAGVKIAGIVVRSDKSGTSFIFADWLAKNCAPSLGFTSTNGFPTTAPNWTAVWAANANANSPATETSASGSGGIADDVSSNAGFLGYDSPDYVYPVVNITAYPTYVNGVLPTTAATQTRINKVTYPTTYDVSSIGQQINDQLVAPGGSGYPIVGYTFIDTYSCYSSSIANGLIGTAAQGTALRTLLLNRFYNGGSIFKEILNSQGFVPPAPALITLLKSSGGPLNAASGIQGTACPPQ